MTEAKIRNLFLRPGELFFCCEPCLITTVLGSCVAVTMFHHKERVGAICHALLPEPTLLNNGNLTAAERYKYVSHAIPAMLNLFHSQGITIDQIEVKLFGGANVLPRANEHESPERTIGTINVRRAKQFLEESNLTIKKSHVGGIVGRKLIFNTATGEVLLKQFSHHARQNHQGPRG